MDDERRILIVDDEEDLVFILVDTLESRGYQVEAAYSAQASKEKIETFDAQVALLDVRLGRDSGIDLIAALKQARPGILCVMMTAYAGVDTAVEALHRGAYDYLQKPLDLRYLLSTLDRCFEKLRLESEKAAAEAALRESEQLYRTVVERSHDGIYILRGDRFLFVNARLCKLTGYSEQELYSMNPFEIIHPKDREQMLDITTQRARGKDAPSTYEARVVKKDGEVRYGVFNVQLITYKGDYAGIGSVRDITAHKQAEESLQQHARRLEVLREIDQAILAAQSPQVIAQAALAHIRELIPCQRASVATFDFEAQEGTVLAVHVNSATELGEKLLIPLSDFGATEELRRGEVNVVDDILALPSRALVTQRLRAEKIRSYINVPLVARGELIGTFNIGAGRPRAFSPDHVEVAQEVADQLAVAIQNARLLETERRRRAELEALRRASLRLTASLELLPVLETILDQAFHLASADNAHVFLYDGERLTFGAAIGPEGIRQESFAEPRPEGLTYAVARSEERIVVPNMREHPLFRDRPWGGAIVGLPLSVGGQVVGVMNVSFTKPHIFGENELEVLRLLADQAAIAIKNARLFEAEQQYTAQLTRALEQQQELARLKDEFIQNVSHELRTPLSLVRGYVAMMAQGDLSAEEQKLALDVTSRRVRALAELVDSITILQDLNSRPLLIESITLTELLQIVTQMSAQSILTSNIELRVVCSPDLPPFPGDFSRLAQALHQLLDNACKFSPEGSTVTVTAQLVPTDGSVCVSVADQGIGIPAEEHARIFERFFQVDGSATRRYGGTGLGLALVKEVIEAHGGRVTLESEVGRGSTFTIWLPFTS